MKNKFYIVDVFANEKYSGNQLAVVTNADNLSTKEMQQIAKEFNYSETTFINGKETNSNCYSVRIFTPEEELPFAGHPTLGTAYIIQNELLKKKSKQVNLDLKTGRIPVTFEQDDLLWMRQKSPEFGNEIPKSTASQILGVSKKDIDTKFPVKEISTGVNTLIVPLKDLSVVKKARLKDIELFQSKSKALVIMVFSPETYSKDNELNVRVFTPYPTIPEDPATGSANGCLAAYLVKYNYFDTQNIDIKVEQGYEIGRPSLLLLKAALNNNEFDINVGGKVIKVAEGYLM